MFHVMEQGCIETLICSMTRASKGVPLTSGPKRHTAERRKYQKHHCVIKIKTGC